MTGRCAGEGRAEGQIEAQPVSLAEREARAVLTRVAEPADTELGAALDERGAAAVVEELTLGSSELSSAAAIRPRLAVTDGAQELTGADGRGIRFVCPGEPDWPTQLDDLGAARPFGLWLRGAADLRPALLCSVAMVGSRAATGYGMHAAGELAAGVAERGWTVVSGCALGIDAAAHRGTLAVDGLTVGVLAGGVDVAYPRAHDALIDRIAADGVLISESAPGAAPVRRRFLTRNRIIAALSRGTVVVEAAIRSGATTTARWTEELGRTLMVVPGPITSAGSVGSNEMLRSRYAVPVTRAEEIVEAVGRLGMDLAPPTEHPVRARDGLPAHLTVVLESLPARRASSGAEIARECGLAPDAVSGLLGELAALDLVERVDGGWRLTRTARACGRLAAGDA